VTKGKPMKTEQRRKKKKQEPKHGVWLVMRDAPRFLVVRGVEQPEQMDPKAGPVEVGPIRSVAIRVCSGDVADLAGWLLYAALPHVARCDNCQESLAELLEEVKRALSIDDEGKAK